MIKNRGFTLVEITVVLGILGILLVVGTGIFAQVLQTARRVQIQNEVRQNANYGIELIIREIRRAQCINISGTTMTTYGDEGCSSNQLSQFNLEETVAGNNVWHIKKDGQDLFSETVTAYKCTECGNTASCSGVGLEFDPSSGNITSGSIKITLTVQQANLAARSDFCGKVKLEETVSMRKY